MVARAVGLTEPWGPGGMHLAAPWQTAAMGTGTVTEFDGHRGYGTVRAADGRDLFFHCTAVADGSRSVPVGSRVTFTVRAGHLGRWEAADVEPLPGS